MTFWVDNEQCIDCRLCAAECPEGGIRIEYIPDRDSQKGLYFVIDEKCTECIEYNKEAKCAYVCPVDCIHQKPEEDYILWERSRKNGKQQNIKLQQEDQKKNSFFTTISNIFKSKE